MTEQQIRELIVSTARSYLGYNERDGSHRKIIDLYNSHKPLARGYPVKYDDAWCATFVSAVAIKTGLTDIMPTECGCESMIKLYKTHGVSRWEEDEGITPQPGDVIFYDWQDTGAGNNTGAADHVGIVAAVNGNALTIIEGNYSNSVKERTLAINGKYIRGYGLPAYSNKSYEEETDMTKEQVLEIIKEYENGKAAAEPSDWSQEARTWAEGNGLIAGDGSGKMQYKSACTREQMVVFLYRLFNLVKSLFGK